MFTKKETGLARQAVPRDPFALLRQMTSDFDRMFEGTTWPAFRWPALRATTAGEGARWFPEIDVFEKDNRLVTKIDLPGLKKEDVKVEVALEGITITGERKEAKEEKKEGYFRTERLYGSFERFVPLPDGAVLDKAAAEFKDGVLTVTVPLGNVPQVEAKTLPIG